MIENKNKDLQLYIHIPFCVKKCDYCDFLSFESNEDIRKEYVRALINEIHFYGTKLGRSYEISSIFVGGGTPSILEASLLSDIFEEIHNSFSVKKDAEVTIECNPGTVGLEKLSIYKFIGVNRLSFGLQSANDDELKMLGRIHTYEKFVNSYESALKLGIDNINVDVMYGLPKQNISNVKNTLSKVLSLRPNHISCYSLIVEENTKFFRQYKEEAIRQKKGLKTYILPGEDELVQMSDFISAMLRERGLHQYEISNYARKGCECKHNIGYWTRKSYLGVGLGASSLVEDSRFKNVSKMRRYITEWTKTEIDISSIYESVDNLSKEDMMSEYMILGLRMNRGIKRLDFYNAFKISLDDKYAHEIHDLSNVGLIACDEERIYPTKRGMDLQNIVASKFV